MRNAKRSIQSSITVDGVSMIWELHREQNWTTDDKPVGLAIHVWVPGPARRELYLEYPVVLKQQGYSTVALTVRPTIIAAKVIEHIREAIAAGWDPESRGKPFVYEVAELPN